MRIEQHILDVLNDEEMIDLLFRAALADLFEVTEDNVTHLMLKKSFGMIMMNTDNRYNARKIIETVRNVKIGPPECESKQCETSMLYVALTLCEYGKDHYNIDMDYNTRYIGISRADYNSKKYKELISSMEDYLI